MKFCTEHWQALRGAVEASGLGSMVADSGERAAKNFVREATEGPSIDTFDPLMTAHNAILTGAMGIISDRYQQNPLMLMAGEDAPGVTWPTCPICALNWCHAEHDRICVMEGCSYPKGYTYDTEAVEQGIAAAQRLWDEITDPPALQGEPE